MWRKNGNKKDNLYIEMLKFGYDKVDEGFKVQELWDKIKAMGCLNFGVS
jgi:hypothetical protein